MTLPFSGTMAVQQHLDGFPLVTELATEALEVQDAEVLQVMYEIGFEGALTLLPPALHPTLPPAETIVFYRCPDSPAGPFTLAQIRITCRAGVRPRALLYRAFIDNPAAGAMLRERWAYDAVPADVTLRRFYDSVVGSVALDGRPVLRVLLTDPEPIAGQDIQFSANLNPARVKYGEAVLPRLVQASPRFAFQRADRGRPRVDLFDVRYFTDDRIRPAYPISAHYAVCNILLPPMAYLTDPEVFGATGTERVENGVPVRS